MWSARTVASSVSSAAPSRWAGRRCPTAGSVPDPSAGAMAALCRQPRRSSPRTYRWTAHARECHQRFSGFCPEDGPEEASACAPIGERGTIADSEACRAAGLWPDRAGSSNAGGGSRRRRRSRSAKGSPAASWGALRLRLEREALLDLTPGRRVPVVPPQLRAVGESHAPPRDVVVPARPPGWDHPEPGIGQHALGCALVGGVRGTLRRADASPVATRTRAPAATRVWVRRSARRALLRSIEVVAYGQNRPFTGAAAVAGQRA